MGHGANIDRRYDLDWLRVIVFGVLILYHIGMFYSTWGYHVKSVHASETVESLMKLINPWRLTLLFFISGIAIRFAIDKQPLIKFTFKRSIILLIPIIFCIHTIIAPQSWLELLENGEITSGFWAFYPEYLIGSIDKYTVIIPTWNHLWYVVYLFFYTLLLIPIARPLASFMNGYGKKMSSRCLDNCLGIFVVMLIPVIPFIIFHYILKPIYPSTHALFDDWANHQLYFSIFIFGFLIAKDKSFWQAINKALIPALIMVFIISTIASIVWYLESHNHSSYALDITEHYSEKARKTAYAWFSIVALLAISQRWLNKPSKALSYMTEAVFPWYILHQTLIVMIGYWLTRQGLSIYSESLALILLTFLGCYLINEYFIRRWKWIRPLFGLKLYKLKY
ncbi:acyltransferase family protein [Colwellia sp. BRX10-4]|jgi:glucan biosynthesis protein C|uniref:acyltransferase family protein n=2 Tax=unclassified Colwellia TaxID=196834 RepID=UPI0015F777FE|nr:acyltransferase family protein [Colwellia sp. BRX10-4]MBA6399902.1 acyltransferase family protein [Colwellia sp. BRX10-4]